MTTTLPRPRVPGPSRGLPGRHLLALRDDPLRFLTRLGQTYGDVARFSLGPATGYLVNQPAYIREVLVTQNQTFRKGLGAAQLKRMLGEGLLTSAGDFHLRQRRLIQPMFHRRRVEGYGAIMAEAAQALSAHWRDGTTIDASAEMMRLTLTIVARALFAADVEGEASEIGAAVTTAMRLFAEARAVPFINQIDKITWLPRNRRLAAARARLDATVYRMIAEHRASGDRGDLLSLLLAAEDTAGDGRGMTDLQVRDEAMTLFLAGHETTANALTWTWFLLARHPAVEARLHAELDALLGGRPPTAADFARLRYTEMVLAESMRLFPPAWTLVRRAAVPATLGPYALPAGALVFLSQFVTHRDPRFWPDPRRFDPERWTPAARAARPKFAYFPFGGGPRLCIGKSFAWMEGVLVLATLAQRWRLRRAPGPPVVLAPAVTLRPRDGIRMRLERRP